MAVDYNLFPLPTDPMPGVRVWLDKFGGIDVPLTELGHGTLHLISYGWGLYDPHAPLGAAVMSEAEVKAALEEIEARCEDDTKAPPVVSFNWKALLTALAEILLKLMRGEV